MKKIVSKYMDYVFSEDFTAHFPAKCRKNVNDRQEYEQNEKQKN